MIVRNIRNVRYTTIIRVLYRTNCIIKIQRWWRGKRKMYYLYDRQIILR